MGGEKGGTPSEGDVIVQFGYISEYGSITSENGAAIRDRQRAVLILIQTVILLCKPSIY